MALFDTIIFDGVFEGDETTVVVPPPSGPSLGGPWVKIENATGVWTTSGAGGGVWVKIEPPGTSWAS